jgi:hypothetical protein
MPNLKTRCMTISLKQDITKEVEQYGKYAWILHDKDVILETGELKDAHYHYYLEFPNARSINSVADELGIEPNFIEVVRDKKGILNYLIHAKNPDKYQYDISEVHSNFDLGAATASLDMLSVLNLLDDSDDIKQFISEVVKRGMTGNPITNLCNIFKLWNIRKGKENDI